MPDYTPILKTPIPLKPEADDVPAAMMAAFVDNEKASVPTVDTITERDAEYNGTDISLVVVRNPPSIWAQVDDGIWRDVWSDTGWKTITSFLGGWSAGHEVGYRVKGGICYWRGAFRPPAQEDQEVQKWLPILNVPSEAAPTRPRRFAVSSDTSVIQLAMRYDPTTGQLFGWLYEKGAGWLNPPDSYPID